MLGLFNAMVFLPLMPKGVEHKSRWRAATIVSYVFLPLMPKGVEHLVTTHRCAFLVGVFLPLMPKGVEHLMPSSRPLRTSCVPSVDAERR